MPGLLADVNLRAQFRALVSRFLSEPWRDLWREMAFSVESFSGLGLPRNTPDSDLWRFCQQNDLVLVTGNRNGKGKDSLEATIEEANTLDSLPVFTLANPDRILRDRAYADRTADRFLEYLVEIDRYRGVGRIYLP